MTVCTAAGVLVTLSTATVLAGSAEFMLPVARRAAGDDDDEAVADSEDDEDGPGRGRGGRSAPSNTPEATRKRPRNGTDNRASVNVPNLDARAGVEAWRPSVHPTTTCERESFTRFFFFSSSIVHHE